jgi:MFS family permease
MSRAASIDRKAVELHPGFKIATILLAGSGVGSMPLFAAIVHSLHVGTDNASRSRNAWLLNHRAWPLDNLLRLLMSRFSGMCLAFLREGDSMARHVPHNLARHLSSASTWFSTRLASSWRALALGNYRSFWIGQAISFTGTWMQITAQAWLALQLTSSPLTLSLVTALRFLPVLLLMLIGGELADRLPRRRLFLITQTSTLVHAILFGVLVAFGMIQLWNLYVLSFVGGVIAAVDGSAEQSFVAELVDEAHLSNAIALNAIAFNTVRIVGPGLSGLLIGHLGVAPVLILNGLSFVPIIVVVLRLAPNRLPLPRTSDQNTSIQRRLMEGLEYARRTPPVLAILLIIATIGTFGYNTSVLLPLVAKFVVQTDAVGLGLLSAYLGIGSLLGAMLSALVPQGTLRWLLVSAACFSVLLGGVGFATPFALAAGLLGAFGLSGVMTTTIANTLLQRQVPDVLRGG